MTGDESLDPERPDPAPSQMAQRGAPHAANPENDAWIVGPWHSRS